jgi:uncharacterized membrane protein
MGSGPEKLILPFAGVLALCIALVILILVVRKWFWSSADESTPDDAFSLQGLRDMRARGIITDVEFEAMKAHILESARRSASPTPHKSRES